MYCIAFSITYKYYTTKEEELNYTSQAYYLQINELCFAFIARLCNYNSIYNRENNMILFIKKTWLSIKYVINLLTYLLHGVLTPS